MISWVRCLVLLAAVCVAVAHGEVTCASDTDCGQDHCCVLESGVRYGGTSCRSLGQVDASCRPNDEPMSTTLKVDPWNTEVPVRGVHHGLCPCQPRLRCLSGSCQHPLPQGSESHPAQVAQRPRLPQGSESHPAQVPQRPRLPQGSESHPAQVPQRPRLPQGSESRLTQIPRQP